MLHYRHNNFFGPVTLSERDRRQRKQIIDKETDTAAIMLYLLKKREDMRDQNKKAQITNKQITN